MVQDDRRAGSFESLLALGQGVFYLVTAIWPLVHIQSFMRVTGPKRDTWLVKTVAVVIAAIGLALTVAGVRRSRTAEAPVLAITGAAGLTAIDVVYVSRRTISRVYLLDAVAEIALVAGWLLALMRRGAGETVVVAVRPEGARRAERPGVRQAGA